MNNETDAQEIERKQKVKDIHLQMMIDIQRSKHSHSSSCEKSQTLSQKPNQIAIVSVSPGKGDREQASDFQF